MALTAAQRNRLPAGAFAYPSRRAYPVPTKAQARAAGISEPQRLAVHRNALARAAQVRTSGTYGHVARKVASRATAVTLAPRMARRAAPRRSNRSRRISR